MTFVRLLAAALVLCSFPALAQKQAAPVASPTPPADASKAVEVVSPEPWKLVPNQPADVNAERNPLDRLRIGDYKAFQFKNDGSSRILSQVAAAEALAETFAGQQDADKTCYTIRSYVVARDAKDSDSTHPAGYSTCRPANRYHVRSADVHAGSGNR